MIKFGTDGWRGIIGEDYTAHNVCLVAQAIADYINNQAIGQRLAVGYDARFMSRRFAEWVARVLAANNIEVLFSDSMCPSPAISWAAKLLDTAGGVMITASHNPAEYNGIKFKTTFGGSASPEVMAEIEKCLRKIEADDFRPCLMNFEQGICEGRIKYFNATELHQQEIAKIIDMELIAKIKGKVVFDAMYGSAMGYITQMVGQRADCSEIRAVYNPSFGGVNPEPIGPNLAALMLEVKRQGAIVGLATDGDGDRIGAIDADGTFINSHQIIAILTKYLVEKRGWQGEMARTCTVSTLVEKVANKYGITMHLTPVGFKYICDLMLTRDILIGGEESGGIGIKNYIPERDGVLLALLLLEAVAAYGQTLGEILAGISAELGHYYFDRIDIHIDQAKKIKLMNDLQSGILTNIAGAEIQEVIAMDGIKFLTNNGWLMFRPSGTEPLMRIYAEANSPERLLELKEFSRKLLG